MIHQRLEGLFPVLVRLDLVDFRIGDVLPRDARSEQIVDQVADENRLADPTRSDEGDGPAQIRIAQQSQDRAELAPPHADHRVFAGSQLPSLCPTVVIFICSPSPLNV